MRGSGRPLPLVDPGDCRACPRLAAHLEALRAEVPEFHNAPVGAWGDPAARLLVLGLAPGRGGANRTGVPFTGDASGDWLWEALHRAGFAEAPEARDRPAVLAGAMITNAVKCVPPGNRPLASEVGNCGAHLRRELEALRELRLVVALGRVAHEAFLAATGGARAQHPFAHGALHRVEGAPLLLDSFHPSPLNTRTGRLSRAAWRRLWARAARLALEPPPSWSVYMLRCADGSIYTGVTTDLARRFAQHRLGRGARYTRSRGASEIVWSEPADSKSAALSREWQIKQLTRAQKLALARTSAR